MAPAPGPARPRHAARDRQSPRGRAYRTGDRAGLAEVYQRLGDQLGTRKEKREVTSAFAGGALFLLGAGGLMSLRFFGRLP